MATYISKVLIPGESTSRAVRDDSAVRGAKVNGLSPTSGKGIELSTDATTGDISINLNTQDTNVPVLSSSTYDDTKDGLVKKVTLTENSTTPVTTGDKYYTLSFTAVNYTDTAVTGVKK